ncbi:hypothetical protein KM1_284950, partial [Entamoeba histolytica HM-3:IMSS]
FYFYFLLLLYY